MKTLKKRSLKKIEQRMDFHSPPHFPFHKNRYIYSEFLWKAGLAEKGPCTDLLSSEPSLGIPSPFFLHEARRKNTKVTRNKRTFRELPYLFPWHTTFLGGLPQKQNYTNCKEQALTETHPAWLPPTSDFVKSHSNMNSCSKTSNYEIN